MTPTGHRDPLVLTLDDAARAPVEALAILDRLGARRVDALPWSEAPALAFTAAPSGLWGLSDAGSRRGPALRPDFDDPGLRHRVRRTRHAHEPLRDALASKQPVRILDATGGLGVDAYLMATWGHEVHSVERHPLLAWLLRQAHAASPHDGLHLLEGDARAVTLVADIIYLDPMYPPSKNTALPSGELQLLRRLLADDAPAPGLLAWARAHATWKVVVKRPKGAEPLDGVAPAVSKGVGGTRFDVYVTGSAPD